MTQERRTGSATRTLSYTAFNQVKSITRGTHTTRFVYDPTQSRVRRTDVVRTGSGASTTTTLYLRGAEKVIAPDNSYTYKRYVSPGVLIEQAHDRRGNRTGEALRYLLYDHLGSLDVVTDAAGTVVQDLSFDAWGQRRAANDWTTLALLRLADTTHGRYTTRGFTGHEMLDAVGIIHMNGRIYDPKLARFLQADPVIQFPHHAQSYNRYSYVLNNPLAYTDPSGHLVFSLFATALATILALESAGLVVIAAVIGSGVFADALVQGASVGEAFLAGVSAAALAYVGGRTFPLEGFGWNAETWVHLATVSTVGGITSSLQGGRFGHGFVAAGLGAATGGIPGLRGTAPRQVFARAVVSAVTGGTISAVTGGKFANGAAYGAFASLVSSAAQAAATGDLSLDRTNRPDKYTKEHFGTEPDDPQAIFNEAVALSKNNPYLQAPPGSEIIFIDEVAVATCASPRCDWIRRYSMRMKILTGVLWMARHTEGMHLFTGQRLLPQVIIYSTLNMGAQ